MSETGDPDEHDQATASGTPAAATPLEQGREARRNGDLSGALAHFEAARKAAPNNAGVQCEVAQTLHLLGRPHEALIAYKKVLERAPDNVRALTGASLATFKLGNRNAALKTMEGAVAAAKSDPKKLLQVANGFREISEPQRASEILRSVVRAPDAGVRARAIRLLTSLAADPQDQSYVVGALDSAATEAPDDPQIQFSLAEAICLAQPDWMQRGQSRERTAANAEQSVARARSILEELAARHEGAWRAKAFTLLARIARYEHRWDDALSLFEKAAAVEPDKLNLLCQVGFALCDLSRLDEAKHQFELVLAKDAGNVEALLGLGDVARLQEDLKGAVLEYERAAALAPTNAAVHARLRSLRGRVGGFDWRAELDSAIEVVQNPGSSRGALVQAATVLLRYGVTDVLRPVMGKLEDASTVGRQIAAAVRGLERAGLARSRSQFEQDAAGDDAGLDEMAGVVSKLIPDSETLLVIFAGVAGQIDITFALFHRLLRATGASALFVRDIEDTRYLGGIAGLGRDFDSTVAALRGVVEQAGARRLLMIGNCQGAPAAIRYGLATNAEAVLGLDPRIGLPGPDTLRPVDASRVSRALTRYTGTATIAQLYSDAKHKPHLTLIYDNNHEPYAARARELGTIEGVTSAGIPVVRSPLLRILLAEGLLTPILNDFVASGRLDEKLLAQLRSLSKE